MMAIFIRDLRLILRDRTALVLAMVAPLVMITVVTQARSGSIELRPLLPVVDDDEGPAAKAFVALLARHTEVTVVDRATAEHMVRDRNEAAAAIVLPAGLSRRFLQGLPNEIELLTDPAQGVALGTLKALLLVMDRDAAELADPLHEDRIVYREQNLTGERLSPKSVEQNVPGFTIMFVLLAVVFGSASAMHDERNWGTLSRLIAAPVGFAPLLLGKLGARVVVGCVQTLVLLFAGYLLFGLSLGTSPAALFAVALALATAAASLGLLVAAAAASREQALPLSLAVTLGLAALGGLWWPIAFVPAWLRTLGECFFPTWAMYALVDVILRDRGLSSLAVPLTVLVGQGTVLLLIGACLFRYRHTRP